MNKKNKGINKKQLIIIIAAAVVIIASLIVIIIALNSGKSGDDNKQQQTTAATAAVNDTTEAAEKSLPDSPPTSETPAGTEEPETMPTIDINIPTEGGEVTHFDGVYVPDSYAEDVSTGAKVSMRSLFGSGYSSGAITFSSDGTFTDTLSMSGTESGAYNAENRQIVATYLPDRQMNITVIEWNEASSKPDSFYIIYSLGGDARYKVYFSEKQ